MTPTTATTATTPKMNPEVKQLWLNALRSGKYTQCTGQLRSDLNVTTNQVGASNANVQYCVLGVLFDLAVRAGVIRWEDLPEQAVPYGLLPKSVMEWAALPPDEATMTNGSVACLNDCRSSFEYIADVIEANL